MTLPRLTFGIITLNGLPWLGYNLRALYPFAHQIIVVEGAVQAARSLARPDGHSQDGTFEFVQRFQAEEDPQGKVVLVQAADDGYATGFWPEKNEMSQAYARRATGDWLWQVDGDEFYMPEDIQAIVAQLQAQPEIGVVSFPFIEFWGSFTTRLDGALYRYELPGVPRLFRWRPGYTYADHRPPTVLDEHGRDLATGPHIAYSDLRRSGITMYHYSYVLPKQAEQKVGYYAHAEWTAAFRDNERWLREKYYGLKDPLFIGEKGRWHWQWLETYRGPHPPAIQQLQADLARGALAEPLRPTEDIQRLLASPAYAIGRALARLALFFTHHLSRLVKPITRRLRAAAAGK